MSSCKYCRAEGFRVWDYPKYPLRILKGEFNTYHLTTTNGEYVMKINYCPKCGRELGVQR